MVVGVLVVVGCALASLVWHSRSTATRPALVLAHDVAHGQALTESDFAPAEVAAQGMQLIAYEDRDRMIGRIAVADLTAATPLTDSVALSAIPLAAGEGLVGRRLEAGEAPVGLAPGDRVEVVLVVETGGLTDNTPTKQSLVLDQPGTVEAVSTLDGLGEAVVVTLRLPSELARQVASADGVRLIEIGA